MKISKIKIISSVILTSSLAVSGVFAANITGFSSAINDGDIILKDWYNKVTNTIKGVEGGTNAGKICQSDGTNLNCSLDPASLGGGGGTAGNSTSQVDLTVDSNIIGNIKGVSLDDDSVSLNLTSGSTPQSLHMQTDKGFTYWARGSKVFGVDSSGNTKIEGTLHANTTYIKDNGVIGGFISASAQNRGSISLNATPPNGNAGGTFLTVGIDEGMHLFINGSKKMSVDSSGKVTANSFVSTSDRRLKKDIIKLNNSLAKINSLNGYSYIFKSSGESDIGVIAQEVEKVFPDLVQTGDDGMKAVKYSNLIAPIIEAIKELTFKIEDIFNKYLDQQQQINDLENRLYKLENK